MKNSCLIITSFLNICFTKSIKILKVSKDELLTTQVIPTTIFL